MGFFTLSTEHRDSTFSVRFAILFDLQLPGESRLDGKQGAMLESSGCFQARRNDLVECRGS